MDIYNEIVSKIHECESKKIPISDFGHKYGFKNVNLNHIFVIRHKKRMMDI